MSWRDQLKELFYKFDEDGSGTLEVSEMLTMFNKNGIPIIREQLEELFELSNSKVQGSLDLNEFINLMVSEEARESKSFQSRIYEFY